MPKTKKNFKSFSVPQKSFEDFCGFAIPTASCGVLTANFFALEGQPAFSVSKKNFEEVFRDPKILGGFFWFSNWPQQAAGY